MCQFTNLIHWLVLHTPLEITEHHHHDGVDLFPDDGRTVPFGTGTSIMYPYLDYRFKNTTADTYQLILSVSEDDLRGEIRCSSCPETRYEILSEGEHFSEEDGAVYRNGEVFRSCIGRDGSFLSKELIRVNHAKVMYDPAGLPVSGKDYHLNQIM